MKPGIGLIFYRDGLALENNKGLALPSSADYTLPMDFVRIIFHVGISLNPLFGVFTLQ